MDRDTSLELISAQVSPSVPAATAEASALLLRLPHGAQLNCPRQCRLVGWRSCCDAWLDQYTWQSG